MDRNMALTQSMYKLCGFTKENSVKHTLIVLYRSQWNGHAKRFVQAFNPLTAEWALRALIDFTLSNARRFYSSMGNPLDGKGLSNVLWWRGPTQLNKVQLDFYWVLDQHQLANRSNVRWIISKSSIKDKVILCTDLSDKVCDKQSDQKSRMDKGIKELDFKIQEQFLIQNVRGEPKRRTWWHRYRATRPHVISFKVLAGDQLWKRNVDQVYMYQTQIEHVQIAAQMFAFSEKFWW